MIAVLYLSTQKILPTLRVQCPHKYRTPSREITVLGKYRTEYYTSNRNDEKFNET